MFAVLRWTFSLYGLDADVGVLLVVDMLDCVCRGKAEGAKFRRALVRHCRNPWPAVQELSILCFASGFGLCHLIRQPRSRQFTAPYSFLKDLFPAK
jgi:hypothetical protein